MSLKIQISGSGFVKLGHFSPGADVVLIAGEGQTLDVEFEDPGQTGIDIAKLEIARTGRVNITGGAHRREMEP